MNAEMELHNIIYLAVKPYGGTGLVGASSEAARQILAAGYWKPRTISTVEELDALPWRSVIRSDEGSVFEKYTMWHEAGSRDPMRTDGIALPVTVLDAPQP